MSATIVEAQAGAGVTAQVFAEGCHLTGPYRTATDALDRGECVSASPILLVLLPGSSAAPHGARCRCGWSVEANGIRDAVTELDTHRAECKP